MRISAFVIALSLVIAFDASLLSRAHAQRTSASELLEALADPATRGRASNGIGNAANSAPTGARADTLVTGLVELISASDHQLVRSSAVGLLARFSRNGHPSAGPRLFAVVADGDERVRRSFANVAFMVKPEALALRWLVEAVKDTSSYSEVPESAVETLERMGPSGRAALEDLSKSPRTIRDPDARNLVLILKRRGFRFRP